MVRLERALHRVMLVEDDKDILEISTLALQDVGALQVTGFSDGETALRHVAHVRPDLILLDWKLPGLNGEQLFGILRGQLRIDVPVVFFTASASAQDVARMLALGAADVVTKPFPLMQLAGRLHQVWDRCVAPQDHVPHGVHLPDASRLSDLAA